MTDQEIILIHTKTEKPKNCKVKIDDIRAFYKIAINKDDFDILDEQEKNNVYQYVNELQEKITELGKVPLLVLEDFND